MKAGTLASWIVFPLLFSAHVVLTLRLLSSDLPRPLVSVIGLVSTIVAVLVLERVAPLHREWNRRPDWQDVALAVGNRAIDVLVVGGTIAILGRVPGSGLHLWPKEWPLALQAILGITIGEGLRYLLHRLSHRPGVLGRVHATHHQPKRMYVLNGPRLHPGNQLWLTIANVVPMLVLGADLSAVIFAVNVTVFFVLLQHANLSLSFFGWNQLLATPDVHRLHHLKEEIGVGVNYGIVLLVFDRLFGTYHAADRAVGVSDIGSFE